MSLSPSSFNSFTPPFPHLDGAGAGACIPLLEPYLPLYEYASSGNKEALREMKERDPDQFKSDGQLCLGKAITDGNTAVITVLEELEVSLSLLTLEGENAINHALCNASTAKLPMVQFLIDKGVGINKRALWAAAESGNVELLNLLLSKASTELKEEFIESLEEIGGELMEGATSSNNVLMMEWLYNHGVRLSFTTASRFTSVSLAAYRGNRQALQFLIDHGAHHTTQDSDLGHALYLSCYNNQFQTAALLLHLGASLTFIGPNQNTALHAAVICRSQDLIELLLKAGMDIEARNAEGKTPLHIACENQDETTARSLIQDYGANLSTFDLNHQSPLLLAIKLGQGRNIDWIADLMVMAASAITQVVNHKDKMGYSTFYYALNNGMFELAQRLSQLLPQQQVIQEYSTFLVQATKKNQLNVIQRAVSTPFQAAGISDPFLMPIHILNPYKPDTTLLMIAAEKGYTPLLKFILEWYMRISANDTSYAQIRNRDGMNALHLAAMNGHVDTVSALLHIPNGEIDLECTTEDGSTALLLATKKRHLKCMRQLIDAGASYHSEDNEEMDSIDYAKRNNDKQGFFLLIAEDLEDIQARFLTEVAFGDLDMAKDLLASGEVDINACPTNFDFTPLTFAIKQEDEAGMCWLISQGANVDCIDKSGDPPIVHAANSRNSNLVQVLLDFEADPNTKSRSDGSTALHATVKSYDSDDEDETTTCLAIAEALLDKGARVDLVDNEGNTPLHYATSADMVDLLYHNGAEIDAVNPSTGYTPLLRAVKYNQKEVVKELIEKGASLKVTDKDGNTPLLLAVLDGHNELMELLCESGADVNQENPLNGNTPLMAAAKDFHDDIVAILLEYRADPNAINRAGLNPLHCVFASLSIHAIDDALRTKICEISSLFLKYGININTPHPSGMMLLMEAAKLEHYELFCLFLSQGAFLHARYEGNTVLTYALNGGNRDIIRLCLSPMIWINKGEKKMPFSSSISYTAPSEETASSFRFIENRISPKGDIEFIKSIFYLLENKHFPLLVKLISIYGIYHLPPNFFLMLYRGFPKDSEISFSDFLQMKASEDQPAIYLLLQNFGADWNAVSEDGNPLIIHAIANKDEKSIAFLKTVGLNVDIPALDGSLPVERALRHGNLPLAISLFQEGASSKILGKPVDGRKNLSEFIFVYTYSQLYTLIHSEQNALQALATELDKGHITREQFESETTALLRTTQDERDKIITLLTDLIRAVTFREDFVAPEKPDPSTSLTEMQLRELLLSPFRNLFPFVAWNIRKRAVDLKLSPAILANEIVAKADAFGRRREALELWIHHTYPH